MPVPLPRRTALAARRNCGAILIESLIALALLSLGAAAMFTAFDHLESTSHAARQRGADARALAAKTEAR